MYQIPITSDPYQEQTFEFNGTKIRLTLRYNGLGECWFMDIYEPVNQQQICENMPVAVGVPMCWRGTQPYYFYLEDESGYALDPIAQDDMGARCRLYIGEKGN